MLINYKYITLNVNDDFFDSAKPTVVFLHGFSGSSNDWFSILPKINKNFSPIAIDFVGHGKSSSPEKESDYSVYELIKQINFVLKYYDIKEPILAGYSMGGRAALAFAVHSTNIPRALILESTTPGIENDKDKLERVNNDIGLARNILTFGIDWFADYWTNIPLFESQKSLPLNVKNFVRREKLNQNVIGLANSLRGFGTGKMPSLWNNLKTLRLKTLLITGELDKKFTKINQTVIKFKPNAEHFIIPETGHNTHLEKPAEFTILVNNFLKSL